MKSRFLTKDEKRDVAVAVIDVLKLQHADCTFHVFVADETDGNGLPQYKAMVMTRPGERIPDP